MIAPSAASSTPMAAPMPPPSGWTLSPVEAQELAERRARHGRGDGNVRPSMDGVEPDVPAAGAVVQMPPRAPGRPAVRH
jgi:hypothetical protein